MTTEVPQATTTKTLAVVGNPNTGKTTLFNALTGLSQEIGNYPGVTVDRKIGKLQLNTETVELLDLPGSYSLAAHSPDEMIVADVLMGRQAGIAPVAGVLAVLDASNLNRNLYLVSQVAEVGLPMVIALNMSDVATSRGIQIDHQALAKRLGVAVVPTCAVRKEGLEELRNAIDDLLERPASAVPHSAPDLPPELEESTRQLSTHTTLRDRGVSLGRVEALRTLVDAGGHTEMRLLERTGDGFAAELQRLRQAAGNELSASESEARYAWIADTLVGCGPLDQTLLSRRSDHVDRILTHRFLGILTFIVVNVIVFEAIYSWSAPIMDGIDLVFGSLGVWVGSSISEGALHSLIVDGLIAGVGGVLIFLPQIAILFFFISLLSDCGYMARAAFLTDRLLARCGLSGKSFIPLLSSFACAIPGVMATRTIEDKRDRFTTMMVAPLMSCSARLPVYVIFIGAFIPDRPLLGGLIGLQGLTLLGMYSVGAIVAIPVAFILKKTLLKGEPPPFLMELPSYKWPIPGAVFLRVYQSSKAFVVRAGSIILATTVVMWALAYFPRSEEVRSQFGQQRVEASATLSGESLQLALGKLEAREAAEQLRRSYLGQAGRLAEPLVRPLGWDWRIAMATLASFPAREVIVSVLGTIYSLGGDQDETSDDLRFAIRNSTNDQGHPVYSIPVALSIMVFFALCAQCISTLAVIQRETRSWRWPIFTFSYMTVLAYVGALVTYQITNALGWGGI
jgi:ferrous iron transport protein B